MSMIGLAVLPQYQSVADERTDGRTDRQTDTVRQYCPRYV